VYRRISFCDTTPLDLGLLGSAGKNDPGGVETRDYGLLAGFCSRVEPSISSELPLSDRAWKYNAEDREICKIQLYIITVYVDALDEMVWKTRLP